MKSSLLHALGVPKGRATNAALKAVRKAIRRGFGTDALQDAISAIVASPETYVNETLWGKLAAELVTEREAQARFSGRKEPAPWHQWGHDLEPGAVRQMENACKLPIAVRGALMPDAHQGYGLPIGGVLATDNAVIPYAVGVDIACRMKLSILDIPVADITSRRDWLTKAVESETRFGVGASFSHQRKHPVMDDPAWHEVRALRELRDKAAAQLGSSGSGNHFAEFGTLEVFNDALGLEPGIYTALLSHSGSRGTGEAIAKHYSSLAMRLHPELPKELKHLAWLDMNSDEGQEYWRAMTLMGRYSSANHQLIHEHVIGHLGVNVLAGVENHHNFAWREKHDGRDVIVHRKGATPAAKGVLGVIPGSMASPAFVVRGKGNPLSLNSAAHGAGRAMSRKEAMKRFTWNDINWALEQGEVHLISAGLDEAPMAYKDIGKVMAAQDDLVEPVGRFSPKLVKMAPPGKHAGWRRKKKKKRKR